MLDSKPVIKSKAESTFRWMILFLTCLMMIGNYYSYDIPAALNSQMDEYMGKPEDFETLFSLLYTVYSVPNVILPFFGGYFVDRLGVRTCLFIFATLITAGQLVFAIGLSAKSWPLMFLGRVLFGFGGENLGVANSAILSIWFRGKELAFAFGLNLSIARLGSVFNNLLSPALATSFNIQFALWFGVILCGGSVTAVLFIASVDRHLDSILDSKGTHALLAVNDADENEEEDAQTILKQQQQHQQHKEQQHREILQSSTLENEVAIKGSFSRAVSHERLSSNEIAPVEQVQLRDIFSYKQIFWLLALICVVVYGKSLIIFDSYLYYFYDY
jgi:MFS family permease